MPCKTVGRRKNKSNDGGGAVGEMEDERAHSLVLLNLSVRSNEVNGLTTHGLLSVRRMLCWEWEKICS